MDTLYLIGFVQSIFFTILILTKKHKEIKDYILSAYLLILGFNLIFIYWDITGFHYQYPPVVILDLMYWTLLGPMLFLYIAFSTSVKPVFRWQQLIHLFPLIFVLIAFSGYFTSGMQQSLFKYQNDTILFKLGYIVWMYNSPVYYILLIIKLYKHKKKIKKYYSSVKSHDLKWLSYLVNGFAIFLFFLLFRGLIFKWFNLEVTVSSYHFTWLVLVLYIFGIGFYGNKQKGVFSESEFKDEQVNTNIEEITKSSLKPHYNKTGLNEEEAKLIQEKLDHLMKMEKPYLDYDLTLPKLAGMLETTSHKLSQVINENYRLNFFEFVNKYRINDVKKLLKNPSKADEKIMALAYDCGFNSKSAFYNFFKKETSLTPLEYRNKNLSLIEA